MEIETLAQNIRRLRIAKNLSQKALAETAGLSLPAIKNLERAKTKPRMKTMQAISNALDVELHELFLPVRKLQSVRFRSSRRMRNRENILAEISIWLDNYNYLEEILKYSNKFSLSQIRKHCSRRDIINSAKLCRETLGLEKTEPINNICGLLEHAGIKIQAISMASNNFFGLSVSEEDGGPAIVVNVYERIPVERWIFSAAHELGHLMLHRDAYNVNETEENKDEEKEADIFASHLLMPDEGFRKEWDETAGLYWIDRIFKIKRIFHVSYKTVIFRLIDHGITDNSIWSKFQVDYQKRFNRKLPFRKEPMAIESSEPFGLDKFDFYIHRFSLLIRKAIEKDKISISRGAEMLGIDIEEMRDILMSWEAYS